LQNATKTGPSPAKEMTMKTYTDKEIELIKAKAIQDYLLGRGANDETINSKIRELQKEVNL
jgi:hypothetical protein